MNIDKKTRSTRHFTAMGIGLLMLALPVMASAQSSEYSGAWQETDKCFAQFEKDLARLPDVETTPLYLLLETYDRFGSEVRCVLLLAMTEDKLANIGYFTNVEYRDDLYRRKQEYGAILDIFPDWTAEVKANRPDFNAALQARIDAKPKPYDLQAERKKWLNRNVGKADQAK